MLKFQDMQIIIKLYPNYNIGGMPIKKIQSIWVRKKFLGKQGTLTKDSVLATNYLDTEDNI